jgi:hypothetical protein
VNGLAATAAKIVGKEPFWLITHLPHHAPRGCGSPFRSARKLTGRLKPVDVDLRREQRRLSKVCPVETTGKKMMRLNWMNVIVTGGGASV